MTPHNVLGVSVDATEKEIKQAFRKRALTCHPDTVATESASVQAIKAAEYRQLTEAYEALTGRGRRGASSSGYPRQHQNYGHRHTNSAYYRADGGNAREVYSNRFSSYAQRTARNSWQNGGLLVLSGVFLASLLAFEPFIEGLWDTQNRGKLFKDVEGGNK